MPEKVWVIESLKKKPGPREEPSEEAPRPSVAGKSPGVAATLSLLIWGAGQFYNRQSKLGLLFILLMANFYTILGLAFVYWNFLTTFLEEFRTTRSEALTAIGIIYLAGLIVWIFNILHAYYKADRNRTEPFEGVHHPLLVTFCSILIPGWGQLLNGQPKKAFIFLISTAAGFTAVTALLLGRSLWPTLETVDDRIAIEWSIIAAVVSSPLVLVMWLIGIYDAAKVGLDPVKKEPLHKRFEYAINRIRIKGLARGLIPQLKVFLMLVLLLTLTLVIGRYYFQVKSYAPLLQSLEKASAQRRMVLIPYLLDHLRQAILQDERPHQADPSSR
jgi:TM2 domain-containing membrane protein YozV